MKNGLVTKIEKNFIVVKTKDLEIERVKPRPDVKVGQRIAYTNKDIYRGINRINYKKLSTSLSMVITIIVIGVYFVGRINQNKVYGVVSLDINPSIALNIDEEQNVLKIITKTNISDEVVSKELVGKPIDEVANEIIKAAQNKNFLHPGDPIIFSFVAIEKDDKLTSSVKLDELINKNEFNNFYVYILSDEEYLELSNEADKTVGRKYLEDYLVEKNETVTDDIKFIKNAFNILKEEYPLIDKTQRIEINTSKKEIKVIDIEEESDSNEKEVIEEKTAEEKAAEEKAAEEKAAEEKAAEEKAAEEKAAEEKAAEEKAAEEKAAEEKAAKEETDSKREEQIQIAKANMNNSYKVYLEYKDAEADILNNLRDKEALLVPENEKITVLEDKYKTSLQLSIDFTKELETVTNILETEMMPLLDDAVNERRLLIDATEKDKRTADNLMDKGDDIYSEQLSIYKPVMVSTIVQINNEINIYEEEVEIMSSSESAVEYETLINSYNELIDEKKNIIYIIENQSDVIPERDDNYSYTYNIEFLALQSALSEKKELYKKAEDLLDKVEETIEDANAVYESITDIVNTAYADRINRKEYLIQSLKDITILQSNITNGIESVNVIRNNILGEIALIETLYQEAVSKRKVAYNDYLSKKSILEEIEKD